ncbi:MAG: histidine phosphatase family protein [Hyphomicrobiales bacterium]
MRTLIFLRHAKSSWALPGIDDFDRPLNERGNNAAPQIANWLVSEGIKPDVIVCSSAKRTQETLAHMEPLFGQETATIMEPDLYLAPSSTLFSCTEQLDDTFETVMLLAHNPGLHDAALSVLTAASRRESGEMRSRFPTCACAVVSLPINSWSEITTDIGELNAYMTPRRLPTS